LKQTAFALLALSNVIETITSSQLHFRYNEQVVSTNAPAGQTIRDRLHLTGLRGATRVRAMMNVLLT